MYGTMTTSPHVRRTNSAVLTAIGVVVASACLVFVGLISSSSQSALVQYQKLDDLSSEFDPFTDADSNYGRVLSLRSLSRTNGPVPEDMDSRGEFKGRMQQLFSMDPLFKNHEASSYAPLPDSGIVGTNMAFLQSKMNKAGQWYEGVEKAPVQMLANAPSLFKNHRATAFKRVPDAGIVGTDKTFLLHAKSKQDANTLFKDHPASGIKRVPDAGIVGTDMSFLHPKTNKAGRWYEGVEKSRVQMLAESPIFEDQTPAATAPLPDAGTLGTDMSFLHSKSNKAGQWYEGVEKSRVQMLARPLRFQPNRRQYATLPEAGTMGTNKAFIGKGDGSGQSTKAPLQQLYDIDGPQATDPRYRDWVKAAGRHSDGSPLSREESIAHQIKAGLPNN